MNIPGILTKAVGLADRMFSSVQGEVIHRRWISHSKSGGGPKFDPTPVKRMAIIDEGARPHRLPTGDTITTKAHIIFLRPVLPHGAAGRKEPFDPRDELTLPTGTTGLVVDVGEGILNPETGDGFLFEVWIA